MCCMDVIFEVSSKHRRESFENINFQKAHPVALVMIFWVLQSLIIQSRRTPFFPAASSQVSISTTSSLSHSILLEVSYKCRREHERIIPEMYFSTWMCMGHHPNQFPKAHLPGCSEAIPGQPRAGNIIQSCFLKDKNISINVE